MPKNWKAANCYGYAVRKNKWLLVNDYEYHNEELLSLNPSWKSVERKDMVLGKSYVAYRYGAHDFHYMFRDHRGHWTHKMGSQIVKPISQKKVFHKFWGGYDSIALYNSRIWLYEVPNR